VLVGRSLLVTGLVTGLVAGLVTGLAGCTDDRPDASPAPTAGASTSAAPDPAPSCSPMPWSGSVLQGRSDDEQSVFAMVQATAQDLVAPETVRVGRSVKLVVRMTGSGDLGVSVTGPGGETKDLDWGPEAHGDSNFGAAGDEWGIGFTFDHPGCWTVSFARADEGTGYVQLAAA